MAAGGRTELVWIEIEAGGQVDRGGVFAAKVLADSILVCLAPHSRASAWWPEAC